MVQEWKPYIYREGKGQKAAVYSHYLWDLCPNTLQVPRPSSFGALCSVLSTRTFFDCFRQRSLRRAFQLKPSITFSFPRGHVVRQA